MCHNEKTTGYNGEFEKLVKDGAEYLIGSCNPLFELRVAFREALTELCSKYLCEGTVNQLKFDNRMEALCERFEQAVLDETIRLEYFNCETCGWWCWPEDRSSSLEGEICDGCYEDGEG